jgi:hypothetical protein
MPPRNSPNNQPEPQYQPPQNPQSGQPAPGQDEPQQVYYQRPLEPSRPAITPEIQQKCEESRRKYPKLNLSTGEFVISDVKRHPIGLVGVWFFSALAITGIIGLVAIASSGDYWGMQPIAIGLAAFLLSALVVIGAYVATFVYNANTFHLTNESVVQNIQTSLFANHEQTVSLGNVEDASYEKHGIIQTIFDFGTIRLSTQGDETTYRFTFASHPAKQIAKLNNAVEAFKNGRPVYDDDDQ